MTSNAPLAHLYWVENYPLLLASLADLTPGMHPLDVAELLAELEEEIMKQMEPGQCFDFSDDALVKLYMDQLVSDHT